MMSGPGNFAQRIYISAGAHTVQSMNLATICLACFPVIAAVAIPSAIAFADNTGTTDSASAAIYSFQGIVSDRVLLPRHRAHREPDPVLCDYGIFWRFGYVRQREPTRLRRWKYRAAN